MTKIFKIILLQILLVQLLPFGIAQAQLAREFDQSAVAANSHQEMKVGIAPGSFDPTTVAHRDLIIESIKRLNLDKFVVAVNVMTAKDFNLSVEERIEMTQRAFGEYRDKVIVVPRPFDDLNKLAEAVRESFSGKLHVVLGEDVFDKNYKLLQHIPGTEFDMIPRADGLDERINLDQYPRSQVLDISFPGISSSASRDLISKGGDATAILPQEVIQFLKERELLRVYSEDMTAIRKQIFRRKVRLLGFLIQQKFNYQLPAMSAMHFKDLQSPEGQIEKVIRQVITLNKLSPEQASELRKFVLSSSASYQQNQRVGYFRGSFDPINQEQIKIVEQMVQDLKLDALVVSVISNNQNTVVESASTRTELARLAFKNNSNVHVITEPLSGPAEVLKLIQKEITPRPIAVFGDNVFEKNYVQLRSLENLEFAVIKLAGHESKTPEAKYEITVQEPKINSKDHSAVFREKESSLDSRVSERISEKGYYPNFTTHKCSALFE